MKNLLLLPFGLFFMQLQANATIHEVKVANYSFTPANLTNVFVGDVVRFVWVSGNHTTTNDPANDPTYSQLPPGAAPWDAPITSSSTTYNYTVTVAGVYKYNCEPHKTFGMVGQFTASIVTPVKLSSFLLNSEPGKVNLTWKTLSEENVDHFSIRRSGNGSTFTEIATVKATGNSKAEQSYGYTDTRISPEQMYLYYYVVIVDKDGKETLTETKLFKNTSSISKLVLSLSPNPISRTGHLMMSFNALKEGKMDVKVMNTQGQLVLKTQLQAYTGVNNSHLHLGDLRAGTYTLVCLLDGVRESHQLMVR